MEEADKEGDEKHVLVEVLARCDVDDDDISLCRVVSKSRRHKQR